jgi:hypothetical protein
VDRHLLGLGVVNPVVMAVVTFVADEEADLYSRIYLHSLLSNVHSPRYLYHIMAAEFSYPVLLVSVRSRRANK